MGSVISSTLLTLLAIMGGWMLGSTFYHLVIPRIRIALIRRRNRRILLGITARQAHDIATSRRIEK